MCVTKKSTKPSSKKTQLVENRRFSQSFRFACTGTEDRARHLSYLVQYGTGGLSSGEQMSGLNKLRLFAMPWCSAIKVSHSYPFGLRKQKKVHQH